MDKLENIIESLLYLSGDAIQIKDIAAKLDATPKEIRAAAQSLKEKYSGSSGIHILSFNDKLQFSSNPDYAKVVESVLNPIKERELSNAMLEVSAIVAYKQPITRLEIEEIRGVNCDYALTILTKRNIVEVVGRKDAIGKPLLYGTTDDFLKRFQISSLDELPGYEDVLQRIKVLNLVDTSKEFYDIQKYGVTEGQNQNGQNNDNGQNDIQKDEQKDGQKNAPNEIKNDNGQNNGQL